jgi:hypothetical protein
MWVFVLFVIGVPMVIAGVALWAWQTREISPSHSNPARRQQAARRSARAAQVRAWGRFSSGQLHRFAIWCGIKTRSLHRPHPQQLPPPVIVVDAPELSHEPGDDGPDDPAWARQLREQVEDPNAHLQRSWSEAPEDTGTWKIGMLDQMKRDGQLPDDFMGRPQPESDDEPS